MSRCNTLSAKRLNTDYIQASTVNVSMWCMWWHENGLGTLKPSWAQLAPVNCFFWIFGESTGGIVFIYFIPCQSRSKGGQYVSHDHHGSCSRKVCLLHQKSVTILRNETQWLFKPYFGMYLLLIKFTFLFMS